MSTASENVKTMLLPTATFVAAYVGEEVLNVGIPISAVVKPRLFCWIVLYNAHVVLHFLWESKRYGLSMDLRLLVGLLLR